MTNRRDSAEEIANRSPPESSAEGDLAVPLNGGCVSLMNLAAPFGCVAIGHGIGGPAEVRIESELQGIMSVDQTRKQDIAGEIDASCASRAVGLRFGDSSSCEKQRRMVPCRSAIAPGSMLQAQVRPWLLEL